MATSTSTSTNTSETTAMRCFLNLRQNSVTGVRSGALGAAVTGEAVLRELEEGDVMTGSLVANGRVDKAIQHIDNQVDQNKFH